ncbi:MAG: RidA family protein, partial [Planctomycetes bacterium]|nr:RidA family protein [Planctomycetota bacterium]
PRGIATKAAFVLDLMERRLYGLGADWSRVNAIDVYTAHSLDTVLPQLVLNRAGPASIHGVRWHYSRPPITDIEFEMDLRGTRTEVHLG